MLGVAGAALPVLQIGLEEDLLEQVTSCRFAVIKCVLQNPWSLELSGHFLRPDGNVCCFY